MGIDKKRCSRQTLVRKRLAPRSLNPVNSSTDLTKPDQSGQSKAQTLKPLQPLKPLKPLKPKRAALSREPWVFLRGVESYKVLGLSFRDSSQRQNLRLESAGSTYYKGASGGSNKPDNPNPQPVVPKSSKNGCLDQEPHSSAEVI